MVRDLAAAARAGRSSTTPRPPLLASPARPIVLLRAPRRRARCRRSVAPGNPLRRRDAAVHAAAPPAARAGRDVPPLVMTSGNLGGRTDRLPTTTTPPPASAGLADALLTHDRPIHVPCDDSVVRVVGDVLLPVRRARGYAPVPGRAARAHVAPVLAVGGELKNTFCLASRRPRLGAASTSATWRTSRRSRRSTRRRRSFRDAVRASTPTSWPSTPTPATVTPRWARAPRSTAPRRRVQHHHAHVAAVHGRARRRPGTSRWSASRSTAPATAPTAPIWGGEVLRGRRRVARTRVAHLADGAAAGRRRRRSATRAGSRSPTSRRAGVAWAADLPPVAAARRRRAGGCSTASSTTGVGVRADDEHGPAVRRRRVAARGAPPGQPTRRRRRSSSSCAAERGRWASDTGVPVRRGRRP